MPFAFAVPGWLGTLPAGSGANGPGTGFDFGSGRASRATRLKGEDGLGNTTPPLPILPDHLKVFATFWGVFSFLFIKH